ncbi:hypothetical protein LTR36_007502 [Oleoguttula mirabilis]|uniref:J domain-containing protein n=1 Tax=Oleoguttula mirabilis TaxID=1507867 RepID=A0AAV9JTK9_9PEZI|nr:hypothetical protein LTR36_007502 [Oleoguttula mirabilis]
MSSAGLSITDLKELVQQDIQTSQALQRRIDAIRTAIAEGTTIPDDNVIDLESESKKMLKDLIVRIEEIEEQPSLTATDRETLQALNARQVVCDKQVMQLAEFRDLQWQALGRDYYKAEYESLELEKRLEAGTKAQMYRKMPVPVSVPEQKPVSRGGQASGGAPTCAVKASTAAGPSMESVAEPVDSRDIGAAPYAASPATHPAHAAHDESFVEVMYEGDEGEGEDGGVEDEEDEEPDKTTWPLCYRILNVDPKTDPHYYQEVCERAYRSLSLQHEPKRLPNDPEAPARWAAITKAYETLTDPARKQYYDMHGKESADLQDFDLSTLSIGGGR